MHKKDKGISTQRFYGKKKANIGSSTDGSYDFTRLCANALVRDLKIF